MWMYAGEKDVDRLSKDLTVKDLEKLVRRVSSLSKKDPVPTSCRVKSYSAAHALPAVCNLPLELYISYIAYLALSTCIETSTAILLFYCDLRLQLSLAIGFPFTEPPSHFLSASLT
jgi:hypothetical protein